MEEHQYISEFTGDLPHSHSEYHGKIPPCASGRERGKLNILKYARVFCS